MVSEKAKKLLEQFDLGEHRFYPLNVISGEPTQMQVALKNGNVFNIINNNLRKKKKTRMSTTFYWLHLVFDAESKNYVDFKNSVFTVESRIQGKSIDKKEIRFDNLTEFLNFRKDKHKAWSENPAENPFHEVLSLKLQIEPTNLPDILSFGTIDSLNMYFTSRLIEAIKTAELKGIGFLGTNKLKLTPQKK